MKTQNDEGENQSPLVVKTRNNKKLKEGTVERLEKCHHPQNLKQSLKTKTEAPEVKAIKAALKAALKAEVKASKGESRQNKKDADLAAEAGEAASSSTRKHGVGLIENKSMSFWKSQNITILKQQAELRGHRFTDLETKGGGTKSKFKKFKRAEYLETLLKLLKKKTYLIKTH